MFLCPLLPSVHLGFGFVSDAFFLFCDGDLVLQDLLDVAIQLTVRSYQLFVLEHNWDH